MKNYKFYLFSFLMILSIASFTCEEESNDSNPDDIDYNVIDSSMVQQQSDTLNIKQ